MCLSGLKRKRTPCGAFFRSTIASFSEQRLAPLSVYIYILELILCQLIQNISNKLKRDIFDGFVACGGIDGGVAQSFGFFEHFFGKANLTDFTQKS